jgi:hypothetical protein
VFLSCPIAYFDLLISVAINLSSVSRLFIAQCHFAEISFASSRFSCITLSHLMAQIRYADSDTRICRSFDSLLVDLRGAMFPAGQAWSSSEHMCRFPHPSIVPRLMIGHCSFSCGQKFFARSQMICLAGSWHEVRMCSIDSVC